MCKDLTFPVLQSDFKKSRVGAYFFSTKHVLRYQRLRRCATLPVGVNS